MDDLAYNQFLTLEKTHWWFIGRRRIFFHLLRKQLPKANNLKILDLGCGFGGMLDGLSDFGQPMGMEIDMESAQFCKKRGYREICLGSGYTLPIKKNSLDLITLFDAIEHIEDDEKVIEQCAGVLKPNGHIMITVPAYQFLYADNDRLAMHLRRYTLSRLKKLVTNAGFDVIKGSYFNVILFPLILPAVLMLKLKQKIRGPLKPDQTGTTNLSYQYPKPIKVLLERILSWERHLLSFISAPLGHSILLIAKKKS